MNLTQLQKKAVKEGIPSAIIEKDYALSVILLELSKSKLMDYLVFKGGTALKKIYFQKARFSEDLDFTVLQGIYEARILKELKGIIENKEVFGVVFHTFEVEKTNAGLRLALKFSGPLKHTQRIRFDFSFRQNISLETVQLPVIDDYELGSAKVKILQLEEIFAEKIQALMNRTTARDLFDTWFLFEQKLTLDKKLVEKKFEYYDEKFEPEKLKLKIERFKLKWNQDLQQFMPKVPNFETTAKEVIKHLEKT